MSMTKVLPPRRYKLSTGQFVMIDPADAGFIGTATWRAKKSDGSDNYHAAYTATINGKKNATVRLHRLVTNAKKNERVIFINGNGLDCRRKNLIKVKIS